MNAGRGLCVYPPPLKAVKGSELRLKSLRGGVLWGMALEDFYTFVAACGEISKCHIHGLFVVKSLYIPPE